MKYDLANIMRRAWAIFKKAGITFAEALHRSWNAAKAAPINAERISKAKAAAGVTEECNTWSGWKAAGREVIHGVKALFGCDLIYATKGDGEVYKARFFSLSQTQAMPA